MDAYASGRRGVGGDVPSNDAMGENWKSALCVTSLYDSYVAVQHENDTLKDEMRQLQHSNELLLAANNSNNTNKRRMKKQRSELEHANDPTEEVGANDSIADLDDGALVQEIRLLRAEKSQQDLLFDKRRAQLEAQVDQYKTLYAELQAKYQQRCELDPLAPQRVAASTRALQHALDQSVLEKEEMAAQHTTLLQLYQQLDADYKLAKAQHADNEVRRHTQALNRVRAVMDKWVYTRVAHAWRQWRLVALSERVRTHQLEEAQNKQIHVDAVRKAAAAGRASSFVHKMRQTSTKRCFGKWTQFVTSRKRQRQLLENGKHDYQRKVHRGVFQAWRANVQVSMNTGEGVWRLERLLKRHATKRAWGKWKCVTGFFQLSYQQREITVLKAEVSSLQAEVGELTLRMEAMTTERDELTMHLQQTLVAHDAHTHALSQYAAQAQQHIGDVLFGRIERFALRDGFQRWRRLTTTQRFLRLKITAYQQSRETRVAQKTVTHWHSVVHNQRRNTTIARQVVQRLRLLGAYRCFAAWREFATVRRERIATLTRVVHHLANRCLIQGFRAWREYHTARRHSRQSLLQMGAILERFRLLQSFVEWKTATRALSKVAEEARRQQIDCAWRQRLAQSKRELQQLQMVFQTWQQTIRRGQRVRQLTSKYVLKWKKGTLGKCVDEWKELVGRRRVTRELLRRFASRRTIREVLRAWHRWRTQTLVHAKDEALHVLEQERDARIQRLEDDLLTLRLADAATKATIGVQEQQLSDELQATRLALTAARGSCSQYKTTLNNMCLKRKQRQIQQQCLRGWQNAVRAAHHRERLVATTLSRKRIESLRCVLIRWNKSSRTRKRILLTASCLTRLWGQRIVEHCYHSWLLVATHQLQVRKATETFEANSKHRLLRMVLTKWQSETHTTRLLRRTLEQIWLSSVHAHMRECFTKWTDHTHEARIHEELQRKQLALDAIRSRVCARWTEQSLTTVYKAWRESVDHHKQSRAGVVRLRRLHDQRLFAIAFAAWKAFHTTIHAQRTWLQSWESCQLRKATVASWLEWKARTIQRRQDEMTAMHKMCRQREEALAAQQDEITGLFAAHERLQAQVENLQKERGEVSQRELKIVVTMCFYHWRTASTLSTLQKHHLHRLTQNSSKRIQKMIFHAWLAVVVLRHEKQVIAERLLANRGEQRLRHLLTKWRSLTLHEGLTNRLVRRLRCRHDRQTRRFFFHEWTAFVRRRHAIHGLLGVLPRLTCRKAFVMWQHATQCERRRQIQQSEIQRRVVAFMMDKQSDALSKYFNALRTLGVARHLRMATADKLMHRTQQRRLRELWKTWRVNRHWHHSVYDSTDLLLRIVVRQRMRMTFHHWRRQDTRGRIERLRHARQQLDHDQQIAQRDREAARTEATELRVALASLEQSYVKQRDTVAATEASCSTQVRAVQRQLVLLNLFTRVHWTPWSVTVAGSAFQRWRQTTTILTQRLAALKRCGKLIARKKQARSFSRWRRHVTLCVRLANTVDRRHVQRCRHVFAVWTQAVRDRATSRRRFLLRWIAATHTRQIQLELEKTTATAFRLWQLHTATTTISEKLHAVQSDQQTQRKKTLLAKWCWRAYVSCCEDLRTVFTQWRSMTVCILQHQLKKLENDRVEEANGTVDQTVLQKTAQGFQSLFRQIAAAHSCSELFEAIASSISRISSGNASGVLYLLDPAHNELWTQRRDSSQIMKAPATLGIAGIAVTGATTLLIENAPTDARFHRLVDQLVVTDVSASGLGSSTRVDLFSTAIVGVDGTTYGALQIAFTASSDTQRARSIMQLLGHACGFFVEQLVYEMVRHSRDRIRARSPHQFTKLFKQNKNWRKYFVQVEREASKTQQQLQQLLTEQELLVEDKTRLESARRALLLDQEKSQRQREQHAQLLQHLVAYKKKTAKLKDRVQHKEKLLSETTHELERVLEDHATYRQQVQAREWQAMLTAAASPRKNPKRLDQKEEQDGDSIGHDRNSDLIQGADLATLKNQLVRTESDNLLLAHAIDVATRHHGELPETLKTEVQRITRRLKHPIQMS